LLGLDASTGVTTDSMECGVEASAPRCE
jgi:hypothetical protein